MKRFSYLILLFSLIVITFAFSGCKKDSKNEPDETDLSTPYFGFEKSGGMKWEMTTVTEASVVSGYGFTQLTFANTGNSVYYADLKATYPKLTETIYIVLGTSTPALGKYSLQPGAGGQGYAELGIRQFEGSSAPIAVETFVVSSAAFGSHFTITKFEDKKISGEFYIAVGQVSSGKILEFKKGVFRNITLTSK